MGRQESAVNHLQLGMLSWGNTISTCNNVVDQVDCQQNGSDCQMTLSAHIHKSSPTAGISLVATLFIHNVCVRYSQHTIV